MQFLKFSAISLLFVLFLGATPPKELFSCREVIQSMLDSIKNIRTETFDVKSTERIGDHLLFAESRIKLNVSPKKYYFSNPNRGTEVLWVEGTNKGNASVHTKSVPLINFDLDPYGSIMRKDQHHTIFDLGSPYVGVVIANTITKAPNDFDRHFASAGMIKWDGRECYQVLITYPEYKYIEYTVLKGETVTSISHKLSTSDYKIRSKNDLSSYFGTIKEGKKLLIPIPYSNRAILYIDKKTCIPVNIKVYDEEGLYEAYEFYNVVVNKPFAANEFSKEFKGYAF